MIAAVTIGSAALVAALLLPWPHVALPAAVAVAAVGSFNRRQLRSLANKWLWMGLLVAVVLPIWVLGFAGQRLGGGSAGGLPAALAVGLTMVLRVLATLAAMLLISGCISPLVLTSTVGRVLGRRLAMACAIGVNLLPAVIEILRRTTLALRLRGGFQRHRLANFKRLLTAVGVQTVRLTEDVAEALLLAEAAAARRDRR